LPSGKGDFMKLIFTKGLINHFECIIAIFDNKVLKGSRANVIIYLE
jgi:hypothetical protein